MASISKSTQHLVDPSGLVYALTSLWMTVPFPLMPSYNPVPTASLAVMMAPTVSLLPLYAPNPSMVAQARPRSILQDLLESSYSPTFVPFIISFPSHSGLFSAPQTYLKCLYLRAFALAVLT